LDANLTRELPFVNDSDVADRIARGFIKGTGLLSPDQRTAAAPHTTGEIYNRLLAFAKRVSTHRDSVAWPPQAHIVDGVCEETCADLAAHAEQVRENVAELREDRKRPRFAAIVRAAAVKVGFAPVSG
jgi:hypothetical protein